MRIEFFKRAGYNIVLLAVLMTLITTFQLHAQVPPLLETSLSEEKISEAPFCFDPGKTNPAARETVGQFWLEAWGRELIVGDGGMLLHKIGATDHWDVLVTSKAAGRYVDRGTFMEEARYAVDFRNDLLDSSYVFTTGATQIEDYVVAGSLVGSTGVAISVVATVKVLDGDQGTMLRLFSIVETGIDSAASVSFAERYANLLNRDFDDEMQLETEGLEKANGGGIGCQLDCFADHSIDQNNCQAQYNACLALAVAVSTNCAATCPGSIDPEACQAACDTLLTNDMATCDTVRSQCFQDANSKRNSCLNACPPLVT